MLVSETSIFGSGSLTVRISSMDGTELSLQVSPDLTIDGLKLQAASQCFHPSESVKTSLYHRLLHVKSGRILPETSTLNQAGIHDNDELLLVKRRIPPVPVDAAKKEEQQKQLSTVESIAKATQHLKPTNTEKQAPEAPRQGDFQSELRKILVSLIDVAQKLLVLNPEAAKFFSDAPTESEVEVAPPPQPAIDGDALKTLQDMGFPANRASRALLACSMHTMNAVQWLLEKESDPELDAPLPGSVKSPGCQTTSASAQSPAAPAATCTVSTDNHDPHLSELSRELLSISGPNKIHRMLDAFRAYRRREFKPNAQALKNLLEMGFEEQQAIDALRRHSNRQEEACEYLLAGGEQQTDPLEGVQDGLARDSGIYKAIMTNPAIQLGLSNPRCLIAFLHMLENPGHTQQWLSDPDTGPMLIQISRIYQAERHTDGL